MFGKLKNAAVSGAKAAAAGAKAAAEAAKAEYAKQQGGAAAAEEAKEEEAKEEPKGLPDEEIANIAVGCAKAMDGLGTDEQALIDLLCPLKQYDMQRVRAQFAETTGKDLIERLKGELRGKFEDIMVGIVMTNAEYDAMMIRDAIKGIGTNEKKLIRTICIMTDEELQAAAIAYKKANDSLMPEDVHSDVGGKFGLLLDNILNAAVRDGGRKTPGDEQVEDDVLRLYKAGEDKIGVDSSVFCQILGSYSLEYLEKVSVAYGKKYGKPLSKICKSELSGDLQKGVQALLQPTHEFFADTLHAAMKGVGTDSETLREVIVSQRDRHLKAAGEYFFKTREKALRLWLKGEFGLTSSDREKALLAIVQHHVDSDE